MTNSDLAEMITRALFDRPEPRPLAANPCVYPSIKEKLWWQLEAEPSLLQKLKEPREMGKEEIEAQRLSWGRSCAQ